MTKKKSKSTNIHSNGGITGLIEVDVEERIPPEYMVINGYVYERQGKNGEDLVNIEFELEEDVIEMLDKHMKKNPGYVNRQELIRECLRNAIKSREEFHKTS